MECQITATIARKMYSLKLSIILQDGCHLFQPTQTLSRRLKVKLMTLFATFRDLQIATSHLSLSSPRAVEAHLIPCGAFLLPEFNFTTEFQLKVSTPSTQLHMAGFCSQAWLSNQSTGALPIHKVRESSITIAHLLAEPSHHSLMAKIREWMEILKP